MRRHHHSIGLNLGDVRATPEVEEEGGEGPVDLVAVLEQSMRKVKRNR